MSKRFSTIETTRILFEHPRIMFSLIQRMDRASERFVRESDLTHAVVEYTSSMKARERARLIRAFSSDNLFHSTLVIDIDNVEGERRLVFQEPLIGLLRACNASLYQELTDARLRTRLVGLWDTQARLMVSSFHRADPDFVELIDDLNEQVSLLIGLLRQNIDRMQGISSDLAGISAEASRSPEQFAQFRQTLLQQIAHLYERHLKPTLAFLNPDTRLEDGDNLLATLESIKSLLDRNGWEAAANQLFRATLSLNAMHRPIEVVAREVDNFLRKTRNGMLQYNAMAHHFERLQSLHRDTQTQDLRKTRLSAQDFVQQTGFMRGLKGHSRPKPYAFGESVSYFQVLFSEIELRLSDIQRASKAPDLPQLAASTAPALTDIRRIEKLFGWIDTLELRSSPDLVKELHGRLHGFIEGYQFPDLLGALNRFSNGPVAGGRVITSNRFRTLVHEDGHLFVYRRRRLDTGQKQNQINGAGTS
ncbi:hypothetical protein [Allohahella marinimesophila]|uniref:Uncharacterized protein n=1 Tax=Allohahella marinimesophila TaxID=1054972 RepID=A0ABP7NJH1_9GAMM